MNPTNYAEIESLGTGDESCLHDFERVEFVNEMGNLHVHFSCSKCGDCVLEVSK